VPIQDETGRLEGIAAILRDVTERWNRDKATRQRLAQLEEQCRRDLAGSEE
jgi:signal transduction histidine kinase